jgi:Protein of unknown function (DUF3108)
MRRRRIALAVASCIVLAGPATADAIRVPYRVSIAGFDVGALRVDLDANRYRIGLDAAFSQSGKQPALRVIAEAAGHLIDRRIEPDLYTASWIRAGANRRIAIAFANGTVGAVAVLPPLAGSSAGTHPGRQARGVLDPLSALAVPAAPSGLAPLSACGRTQRVFDGLKRYDVELFPSRIESIVLAQKPVEAMVCRARQRTTFTPGTRPWPDAPSAYRALIWLAPLADGRLLLPIRIESDLPWGRIMLEATDPNPFRGATRAAALR